MRTFFFMLPICGLLGACSSAPVSVAADHPSPLVTVVYTLDPLGRFEIRGTTIRGVKLEDFPAVLSDYRHEHPNSRFELLCEVKSVPEISQRIEKVFADAGIVLVHHWAAVGFEPPDFKPGPYGYGFVDLKAEVH